MHSSEKIMMDCFKLCWQVSVTQHVPPASQWKSQQPCTLLWRQSTLHPVNSIWNGMHHVMRVSSVWSSPGSHVRCLSPLVPSQQWPTQQFMVTELVLLTEKYDNLDSRCVLSCLDGGSSLSYKDGMGCTNQPLLNLHRHQPERPATLQLTTVTVDQTLGQATLGKGAKVDNSAAGLGRAGQNEGKRKIHVKKNECLKATRGRKCASDLGKAEGDALAAAVSAEFYKCLPGPEDVGLEGGDGTGGWIQLHPGASHWGNQELQFRDDGEGGGKAGTSVTLPAEASLRAQQYTAWSDAQEEAVASACISLQPGADPEGNQYLLCPGGGNHGDEVENLVMLPLEASYGTGQYIFRPEDTPEEPVVSNLPAKQLGLRLLHSLIHSSVVFPGLHPPISPATGLSLLLGSGSCVVPAAGSPVVPDVTRGLSHATHGLSCLQAFARPVLCEKGQTVITLHSANAVVASPSGAPQCSPLLIECQPPTSAVVASPSVPQCSPLLIGCQPPTNAVVASPSVPQCSPLLIGCQPPTNAVVASPSVPQCSPLLIGCQPPTNAVVASPSVPQCSPLLIGCQPPTNDVVALPSVVPQCSPLMIGCQPPTNTFGYHLPTNLDWVPATYQCCCRLTICTTVLTLVDWVPATYQHWLPHHL